MANRGKRERIAVLFSTWLAFEIHSNKFKPRPIRNLGQTPIIRITHTVFFFGVGKDPLNGFLVLRVKKPVLRGVPGVIGQSCVVLPDVAQDSFQTVFGVGAQVPGGTLGADWGLCLVKARRFSNFSRLSIRELL